MAQSKDPPQDPTPPHSKPGAKKPQDYEKVVEELRQVLAGLNKPAPVELPAEDSLPSEKTYDLSAEFPEKLESDPHVDRMGDMSFPPASGLGDLPPSDADFWKGNVLGWPENEPGAPTDPAPQKNFNPVFPPLSVPPGGSPMENPDHFNMSDFGPPPDPLSIGPVAPEPPQMFQNPVSKKSLPPPPQTNVANPFDDFSLPPAPRSPIEQEGGLDMTADNMGMVSKEDGERIFDLAPAPPPSPEDTNPASGNYTILPASLKIPIPGTLHTESQSGNGPKKDQTLEEMNILPASTIQVAVLYPDGREADAEEFIAQLKSAALKSPGGHSIAAVLLNPWFPTRLDIPSWKKAASISGANYLFVLGWKKDKEGFKELGRVVHQDEVRARMISIEQIKLRALYADLLADVLRAFNVKN